MATEKNVTEFAIVKSIMKLLKLDDAGKINKFFSKEVKKAETTIRDIKNYIAALKNTYESEMQKLADQIEDAKESVEASYQAVTPENIVNNEAMERFSSSYWSSVERTEAALDRLEKIVKEKTEAYEKAVEQQNKEISKYQARIDKITK